MADNRQPLNVVESSATFSDVAHSVTNNPAFRERLASVDVLILPFKDIPDHTEPVFPATTRDLYRFLAECGQGKLDVEVAVEAEELEELVLHGDLLVLGVLLVKAAVAPLALGLLTNFIYDRIKRKSGDPDNTTVRCELIVEDACGSRSLRYDGPASSFEKLLGQDLGRPMLRTGEKDNTTDGA